MYQLEPIATIESPYRQRFGIPRQPGLVNAQGSIVLLPGYDDPDALDGLEDFSHLWVTFLFHANADQGWKPKVKPPRLGGRKQVGVYASRSPFRPNFLGLSVLKIEAIEKDVKPVRIRVSGLDLLDSTPVVDIKPYVEYTDAITGTRTGFAPEPPEITQQVVFSDKARQALSIRPSADQDMAFIHQLLELDPRPAYKKNKPGGCIHTMRLADYEVKWVVDGELTTVIDIVSVKDFTE